jgi:hypothetical protein
MEKKEIIYDKRLIERYLRQGRITQKDLERLLKSLPDRDGEFEEDPLSTSKGPTSSSKDRI